MTWAGRHGGRRCASCRPSRWVACSSTRSLFALEAAVAFWVTQGIDVVNIVTHGGDQVVRYPADVSTAWQRRLFVWFVPLSFAVQVPVSSLVGTFSPLGLPPWIGFSGPLLLLSFGAVVSFLWRLELRRYRGTGS